MAKWGAKYKIVNFEVNYALEVLLKPKYGLKSTISALFYLFTQSGNPFMKLQHFQRIIGFKIDDFVFLPPVWPYFLPFLHN